jgi:hypothetical protein
MAQDWSREEVEATVARYLDMLEMELSGRPFVKAEINRALQPLLNQRSPGAIEFKFGNISAVMVDLGKPYVEGYKPYLNYQALLVEVTATQLEARPGLLALIEATATKPAPRAPRPEALADIIVPAPVRDRTSVYERPNIPRLIVGKNYLEMEARNQSLGRAGEEFVVEFERQRLWKAGCKQLSDRVEHVAVSEGDGLGYDVHSFDESGRDRLIEVKTTRWGALTPFYVSSNEVAVSEQESAAYHLYRVFRFEQPRLFVVSGALREGFQLDPDRFKARIA